jgi:Winged helix DNA-binding domain
MMSVMALTNRRMLGPRALNRALLARQLLLRRADLPVAAAVEHLLGLQAQAPAPPYHGLWSRLEGFDPHELGALLTERAAVRLTLMRGTVHLVTVRDALLLRPLVQVVIERAHHAAYWRRMGGADPERLAAAVRELLAGGPLTARELGRRLVERGLGNDAEAIGNAARVHVPLVQVPPRGVWGAGGQARYATLEAWTGRALEPEPSIDDVVLRYLAAFGPASALDAQSWSGLTRLGAVLDRLRPRLVAFADDRGRELFDLPDAPRPDPDVPAPVRLLGQFDNVFLAHADRRRILPEDFSWEAIGHGRAVNMLLLDGMVRGAWWIERDRDCATLAVRPFRALARGERQEVADEAGRMAAFAGGDAPVRDVRLEAPVA